MTDPATIAPAFWLAVGLVCWALSPPESNPRLSFAFHHVPVTGFVACALTVLAPNPVVGLLIGYLILRNLSLAEDQAVTIPVDGLAWASAYVLGARMLEGVPLVHWLWLVALIGIGHGLLVALAETPIWGQLNSNHVQSFAAVCTAGLVGLAWTGSPWWWGGVCLALLPILRTLVHAWAVGKADPPLMGIYGLLVILTGLALWHDLLAGLAQLCVLASLFTILVLCWPAVLSRRGVIWRHGLWNWWRLSLFAKGFGTGASTWAWTYSIGQPTEELASVAHNDYLQVLIEHGLVGLLLLLAAIGGVLAPLYQVPDALPVFLMAWTLCGIAAVSFPWQIPDDVLILKTNSYARVGSAGLNALTWLVLLMAEAR